MIQPQDSSVHELFMICHVKICECDIWLVLCETVTLHRAQYAGTGVLTDSGYARVMMHAGIVKVGGGENVPGACATRS